MHPDQAAAEYDHWQRERLRVHDQRTLMYAKPVTCEPCLRTSYKCATVCVRPCTCHHGV